MNERMKSLLGLARRAGRLASGDAEVEAFMKKHKGFLLLLAEDAPGAQKKYLQWAEDLGLETVVVGRKEELGSAIGLSPRAAVLVLDQGFAKGILEARR
ncbi:MAG: L7Ae/L30e/S12e/Gadd45 family ribosomal protein [Desulfitobacteriaceae bacterium]|nr:L7Ae/L30e/S12e/Gadd45 family ribosomal protein [Desulfitobacteriaceae bacterium]MDI6881068.1 L7Ae/L30e/S12e/Gadd45 family ribosomal protein [Desulfitobacteriaceae bacterium]MDI6914534.1 L7Ae/L30e/S12e/Gadd45 family ribosomal protein [Desulfitobacteriaceae bacterium]